MKYSELLKQMDIKHNYDTPSHKEKAWEIKHI